MCSNGLKYHKPVKIVGCQYIPWLYMAVVFLNAKLLKNIQQVAM